MKTHMYIMGKHLDTLKTILTSKYPVLSLKVENSIKRYDDIIKNIKKQDEYFNDYFIISIEDTDNEITIDATCLYITSLRISIEKDTIIDQNISIDAISSDVKIYLYAKSLQQQTWFFQKISENTSHLVSGLSHEFITQHVVDSALNTIPLSDAVIFRIYDKENNLLKPLAISGFNENYYTYAVSPQESISGKVFETRQSVTLNSREEILSSFKNHSATRDAVMASNPIANALICVPVLDKDYCFGTLTILSMSRHSVFNSLAVSLLETFASQVALAWRNAKLYDEKVASFNEVSALKQQLEQQNQLLRSSLDFHNEMIKLSIKNNKIDDFIHAISQKVNVEIGYIDISGTLYQTNMDIEELWDVLAASRPDETYQETGYLRHNFYIQPMIQNHQAVGFVVIHKADASDYMKIVLSRLSDFLIMDIMKKVSTLLIDNKRKSSIMNKILSQEINENSLSTLFESGFILQEWIACIMLTPEKNLAINEDILHLNLHNKLKSSLSRRNSFMYSESDTFTIFLSDTSPDKINNLLIKLEKEIIITTSSLAGISNIALSDKIKQVYDQATTALVIIKKREQKGTLHFKQTGIERLFAHHDKSEMNHFILDILSPIMDDSDKSQTLIRTLTEYIKNSCSVNNTARSLDIHVNTLYQRIRKIESLTRMSLSDPDDFLIISVACHMNNLSQKIK